MFHCGTFLGQGANTLHFEPLEAMQKIYLETHTAVYYIAGVWKKRFW